MYVTRRQRYRLKSDYKNIAYLCEPLFQALLEPFSIFFHHMNKSLILSLTCCLASTFCEAQQNKNPQQNFNLQSAPKREVRAVWITTLSNMDWPKTYANSPEGIQRQKAELIGILDQLSAANINTVLLQTRVRAATIYPSDIEPWDRCITGREGQAPADDYDPLRFAIDECHKRGMELHAWIATIPVGAWNSLGCRSLVAKGFRIRRYSTGAYMDPGEEQTAEYIASICAEIVRKYDVDGINLDYIRYPDGWPQPNYKNNDTPAKRRADITRIVTAIHREVKALKPWVKMSCSPIGKYSDLSRYSSRGYNARDRVFQEAQQWLKDGLMDQLYPMQYFRGDNYYPFCADWMENSDNKDVATGLGTYFLDPREGNWTAEELQRQMYVSRQLGMGHAHFRGKFLLDNRQGIYDFERIFNTSQAILPAMTWVKNIPQPSAPRPAARSLISIDEIGRTSLSWQSNAPYFNIYMSSTSPVDISDARNLVMARFTGTSFTLAPSTAERHFAVTAMDVYGNESAPLQSSEPGKIKNRFMPNNSKLLIIPNRLQPMDIDYYIVETTVGRFVRRIRTANHKPNELNVSSLKNGAYVLRAHSSKRDVSHRLGFFIIKRR